MKFLIIADYELRRFITQLRPIAIVSAATLLGAVAGGHTPGAPAFVNFVAPLFSFIIMASILAIVLVADLVAGEVERGSLQFLLVRPVSYLDIILGKFIASYICFLPSVAAVLMIALRRALSYSKSFPPPQPVASISLFTLTSIALSMSIGILISSSSKTSANATISGFLVGLIIIIILHVIFQRQCIFPETLIITSSVLLGITICFLYVSPRVFEEAQVNK